jgi:hypothetical protein
MLDNKHCWRQQQQQGLYLFYKLSTKDYGLSTASAQTTKIEAEGNACGMTQLRIES